VLRILIADYIPSFNKGELTKLGNFEMNSKTDKDFWEREWQEIPLEKYYGIERYLAINKKLDSLFKRFLKKGDKKILEIGCAKAKQLIYFGKEFGYKVYGTDYSERGVEIAKENLKIAGMEGAILCEDIFQTSFEEESFDIVYSMGLIEHFENPAEVIDAHIKLLKRGGILIITIPNFRDSLYLTLNKILGKEKRLLETHNLSIMDKKVLNELFQGKDIKILFLDYFGPIDLAPVLSSISSIKSKPLLYTMHIVNQIMGYATFFVPSSRHLSPYLVLIAEKTE
jgi:2-polyprenyl-3-methyl-5-hydroxy-6-metoxy-1,4-benzoquinol methylase